MPLYIAQIGDLVECHGCLTQTLKDRATQLNIKYKSGALVTQLHRIQGRRVQSSEERSRSCQGYGGDFEECSLPAAQV